MLALSDGERDILSPWHPFAFGREASWCVGAERSAYVRAAPTMLICDAATLICTALLVMWWSAGGPNAPTTSLLAFSSAPMLLLLASSRSRMPKAEISLYKSTLQVRLAPKLVVIEFAMYWFSVTAVLAVQIMIAVARVHGDLSVWHLVLSLAICGAPMILWLVSVVNMAMWHRRQIP